VAELTVAPTPDHELLPPSPPVGPCPFPTLQMVSVFMRLERTAGFGDFRDLAAGHVTRPIQNLGARRERSVRRNRQGCRPAV